MSFDLLQYEIIEKFHWIGRKIGLINDYDDDKDEDEVEEQMTKDLKHERIF